jgi:hypothetical protein
MIQKKGSLWITPIHMVYTKIISTIPHHNILSKEDPKPLVTVSTIVMTVVHFAKVSALSILTSSDFIGS